MHIKLSVDRVKSQLTNQASRSLVHLDPAVFAIEAGGLRLATSAEQLFSSLAQQTQGWSGADIHAVCMQARMNALKRTDYREMPLFTEADFAAAMRQMNVAKPESKRLAAV